MMAQDSTVLEAAAEYFRDAAERNILLMEALNERGNTYVAQSAKTAPHVLAFSTEVLCDRPYARAPRQLCGSCALFPRPMSPSIP